MDNSRLNIIKIGNHEFALSGHTYVMGILNVTPDSFSDGGSYRQIDRALKRTEQMIAEGAAIIDIGGESTRPGYEQITDAEEIARTAPVISAIKERFDIPVSLDTYKSQVAEAGIAAGVDLINDIWGLKYDDKMAGLIARTKTACCLMHNRQDMIREGNVINLLQADLQESLDIAVGAGIENDKIILDPGIGFAKSYEQNLMIISALAVLGQMGYPMLLGASRKSVIGQTLDVPAPERLAGTLVTTVYAVRQCCAFVRVHDIKENVQAIKMAEAIGEIMEVN